MTDHTQLRKLATEALHWVPICDEPDCSCREAWKNYADAANPQAILELLDEIERLKKDAERGKYMIKNGCWHRWDDQTHLAVQVPHGSDLSCYAMREAAIDAAMAKLK